MSSAMVHSELHSLSTREVLSLEPLDLATDPEAAQTALRKRKLRLASRWEGFSDRTFSLFTPDAPPLYKARDKLFYTLGVANVILLAFLTGGHSYAMPWYYCALFPLLFACRVITFSHRHWGYFLVDFCYFVNFGLLAYVVGGGPREWLIVLFALAHGPLGTATVLFRNSLVFHSVDYVTSCYIHVAPMLVTFCIRWFAYPGAPYWVVAYDVARDRLGVHDLKYTFAAPMACYLAWGVFYVATATCICPVPQDDPSYLTIFRYLVVSEKGMLHGLATYRGGRYAPLLYGGLNLIFTALSLLPTILLYNYMWLNWAYLGVISLAAIYNGGSYYIDVFSRKYQENLGQLAEPKTAHRGREKTPVFTAEPLPSVHTVVRRSLDEEKGMGRSTTEA